MDSFAGKIAVVTGGGSGMGRGLVVRLAAEGCSVATCDMNLDSLAATKELAEEKAPAGTLITTHQCDVSDAAQMNRFRDEVVSNHDTDHVNLVFNNAGIGGGGSFVNADIGEWEKTFDVDWGGVYNGCRAFVPLLVASDEGYLVNTSSVNGFWARLMPGVPHTAYSAAKFAVKGLSEALIEDFRQNAPHVKVAVVMPGHIGTDIVKNSFRVLGGVSPFPGVQADENMVEMMASMFRDNAPMTGDDAAKIILDAVKNGEWRILVGEDAKKLDEAVRADPWHVYDEDGVNLATLFAGGQ
jgi:NAD(P)-dependent dehydrogenase (short-subunit alcohol dehydrogenase family)